MTDTLANLATDDLLQLVLTDDPDGPTLAMRTTLAGSPAQVWPWLVEPERLRLWSPSIPNRILDSAGPATAFESPDGETVDGEVISVDPPRELVQRWATSLLRWTLAPASEDDVDDTVLVLEHKLEPSAADQASMMAAGWHLCLAVLRQHLAGNPVDRVVGEDALLYGWAELHERYTRLLSP